MVEQAMIIDVLDHGFVRLVDHMGDDLSIVRAARVSYDAAWRAGEDQGSDERLIRYLWKNHHTTPFEAVTFTFEVKAPIFVLRQWHRHRTWSYNELSARYSELPEEYYVPDPKNIGCAESEANKQGRTEPLSLIRVAA
jgi:thymidylate synthase (FAD)